MTIVDLAKLVFQASCGAGHMVRAVAADPAGMRNAFLREWGTAGGRTLPGTPLLQRISFPRPAARLHLGPAAIAGMDPEAVFEALAGQPVTTPAAETGLLEAVACAARAAGLPWSAEEIMSRCAVETPPSHSAAYGPASYRLLDDWHVVEGLLPAGALPVPAFLGDQSTRATAVT